MLSSKERIQIKCDKIEKLATDLYDYSKTSHEMINIINSEMEKINPTHIYNWKIVIDDISNPEFYYQLSKVDEIRTMDMKKVFRNIKIGELLKEE